MTFAATASMQRKFVEGVEAQLLKHRYKTEANLILFNDPIFTDVLRVSGHVVVHAENDDSTVLEFFDPFKDCIDMRGVRPADQVRFAVDSTVKAVLSHLLPI